MTIEQTAAPVKRGRGRPKKVQPVAEDPGVLTNAERDAMLLQAMQMITSLAEKLEARGTSIAEAIPAPPNEVTVVVEEAPAVDLGEEFTPAPVEQTRGLKPGTVLGDGPGASWVPWTKNDLNKNDKIFVTPDPVPGLMYPATDAEGRNKLLVDVNGLQCWMTVGVPQEINRFFYNAYMDSWREWRQLEHFKKYGPETAPWGDRDGKSTWRAEHNVPSFGMDDNARYLPGVQLPPTQAPAANLGSTGTI